MPLSAGEYKSFKEMIRAVSKAVTPPDLKALKGILHSKKLELIEKIKVKVKGKYFSLTTNHWTSLANENYGAITLHFIDEFELKIFILSCKKHENGASAEEMVNQLIFMWSMTSPRQVAVFARRHDRHVDSCTKCTSRGSYNEQKWSNFLPSMMTKFSSELNAVSTGRFLKIKCPI